MAEDQPPKNVQLQMVPGNFATFRASYSFVAHLNGQFIVSLGEDRFVADQTGKLSAANFELGRFEMGPVTAIWLANNVLNALRDYRSKFGDVPKELMPAQAQDAQQTIDALEQMLKEMRDPPEPPTANK